MSIYGGRDGRKEGKEGGRRRRKKSRCGPPVVLARATGVLTQKAPLGSILGLAGVGMSLHICPASQWRKDGAGEMQL